MVRLLNAFTALLFGSGILVLAVGVFDDAYSWGLGVVGMITLWVVAFALRVYLVTRDDDEELGYSRRHIRR
ncbi:MAG: hypothetical protein QUS33_09050 [Dehalococcoidia bacterium]|nr:hypothetical protein [Dehalococcoidia bacterium]